MVYVVKLNGALRSLAMSLSYRIKVWWTSGIVDTFDREEYWGIELIVATLEQLKDQVKRFEVRSLQYGTGTDQKTL